MNRKLTVDIAASVKSLHQVDDFWQTIGKQRPSKVLALNKTGDQNIEPGEFSGNRWGNAQISGSLGSVGFVQAIDPQDFGALARNPNYI